MNFSSCVLCSYYYSMLIFFYFILLGIDHLDFVSPSLEFNGCARVGDREREDKERSGGIEAKLEVEH